MQKTKFSSLKGGRAPVLFAAAVLSLGVAGSALAGITSTKHNLSSSGTGTNHTSGSPSTTQICVFCHTPHGADTTAPAPLWNKALPGTASFTTYASLNSASIDGEMTGVGSVSLACLSCHDGTQAMDNMINAPGSGGYNSSGAAQSYNWTGANMISGIAALGKDLSNDHPIGIQYCGGGPTVAAPGGACVDTDFNAPTSGTIGGALAFWVDTGGSGRQKTDIPLYTRTFTTAGAGPSVECGSCHDPHVADTTIASGLNFMRVTTSGSAICLACHNK